jgi:hypothetical protein
VKRSSKPNKNITATSCLLSVHSLLISNVFGILVVDGGILHDIQNEADGLFGEGCHQEIIPSLLSVNAVKPEPALSRNKPTGRLVHPKGRKTEVPQAINSRRRGEIYQVLLVHVHRGHQCKNAPSEYYSGQVKNDLFHYIISCGLLTTVLADFLAQELAHLGPTIAASTIG